jgi:hypothetical protein
VAIEYANRDQIGASRETKTPKDDDSPRPAVALCAIGCSNDATQTNFWRNMGTFGADLSIDSAREDDSDAKRLTCGYIETEWSAKASDKVVSWTPTIATRFLVCATVAPCDAIGFIEGANGRGDDAMARGNNAKLAACSARRPLEDATGIPTYATRTNTGAMGTHASRPVHPRHAMEGLLYAKRDDSHAIDVDLGAAHRALAAIEPIHVCDARHDDATPAMDMRSVRPFRSALRL